jgi:hypothetical protein
VERGFGPATQGFEGPEKPEPARPYELIFTALAELSTCQIAESVEATGMTENAEAGRKGGAIARKARQSLEDKTGRSVVTGENFLPPETVPKALDADGDV